MNKSLDDFIGAVRRGDTLSVKDAIINDSTLVSFYDEDGWNSLHTAAFCGNIEMVKLIVDAGINANLSDKAGRTPLHEAVIRGHKDVVKYIVESGGNIDRYDSEGKTPLDLAVEWGYQEIAMDYLDYCPAIFRYAYLSMRSEVHELLQNGDDVNRRRPCGASPLHWSVYHSDLEMVRFLLDNNAFVDVQDSSGIAPLHIAPDMKIIELLIAAGSCVNIQDKENRTPLHLAALSKSGDTVSYLIASGANVNARDCYGATPLHEAAINNNAIVISLLLNAGADIDIIDIEGATPLHRAEEWSFHDAINVLSKYHSKHNEA